MLVDLILTEKGHRLTSKRSKDWQRIGAIT